MLSVKDVARIAGVRVTTITRACVSGKIKAEKNGKSWVIDQDSAKAFIADREEKKRLRGDKEKEPGVDRRRQQYKLDKLSRDDQERKTKPGKKPSKPSRIIINNREKVTRYEAKEIIDIEKAMELQIKNMEKQKLLVHVSDVSDSVNAIFTTLANNLRKIPDQLRSKHGVDSVTAAKVEKAIESSLRASKKEIEKKIDKRRPS